MPKIVNRQEYRQQLLDRCFDLFSDKGYAELTMQQIATALDVSTGTLYHYFPSKKALFEQLIDDICNRDILMAWEELDEERSLTEKMEGLGKFIMEREDYFIKQIYLSVDFCQSLDRSEDSNSLRSADRKYLQAIMEVLKITDIAIARTILSFINGLILDRLCGNEFSIVEQMRLMGSLLEKSLETKNS
jgi:AcrR family transcriptional regulator